MTAWELIALHKAGVTLLDCVHATPQPVENGYPYVTIPQMKSGHIDFSDARQISAADFEIWTKKAKPQLHDVVLSRRTNPGVTAVTRDGRDFALGQNLVLLRADGRTVVPQFLRWLVRGPNWWEQVEKFMNVGAVFNSLRCADVPKFSLPIPPKTEQERIAAILDDLDDKIELNRRMNETLEAMAQAIFRDWFVDFGPTRRKLEGATDPVAIMGGLAQDAERAQSLADLFPAVLNNDGLPDGWRPSIASAVVEFNPKEPLRKGTLAFYSDMSSLPTSGSIADLPVQREFGSGMRFRNGDALLARITPCLENGKAAFVDFLPDQDAVGWGSTEYYVLRTRKGVPAELAYLLARHPEFRAVAIASMTGTSGRQRAQVDRLEQFRFIEAPTEVMTAFGKFVKPMFDKISANGRESRTLAAMRDLLLPKLMSGEIRVSEAAEMSEAAQ